MSHFLYFSSFGTHFNRILFFFKSSHQNCQNYPYVKVTANTVNITLNVIVAPKTVKVTVNVTIATQTVKVTLNVKVDLY